MPSLFTVASLFFCFLLQFIHNFCFLFLFCFFFGLMLTSSYLAYVISFFSFFNAFLDRPVIFVKHRAHMPSSF